ncbi:hypothetical protein FHR72_000568 [Mycolicibacterium iranicum]|uniref:Copper chaperone PCu(A)C n=1 Tax=Mycolicibacterium iranicum TaxID=912594 RepID=A0A839Q933_MYCIR|nr:hypothetical protein [Mycolicibacterium iranicum]MBB2989111.1 hypothetical protein [Mycolicibacterium iranicum]
MQHTSLYRYIAPVPLALAAVVPIAGCDDTSPSGSSNRGSGSLTEGTTVENAFIVPSFLPGHCAIQLDAGAAMRFTVTNGHPAEVEHLSGLSTDATPAASIPVAVDIPPKSTVGVGQPSAGPEDAGGSLPAVRLSSLDPQLRPGMSAEVTFHFERAGEITMRVPVEACPTQQR